MTAQIPDLLITYHISLEDADPISYEVKIDRGTLLSFANLTNLPEWTKIEDARCAKCTLKYETHCPVALRLVKPLEIFHSYVSYKRTKVEVVTEERVYVKEVDLQDALRSLFGLIMATSGCPSMRPFRFMARHHLPFSTLEETIIRTISSYMMKKMYDESFTITRKDAMAYIESLFSTMQEINQSMVKRLQGTAEGDSMVNAIVLLNTNSSLIPLIIEQELARMKPWLD